LKKRKRGGGGEKEREGRKRVAWLEGGYDILL
jgi:hypothetical protein